VPVRTGAPGVLRDALVHRIRALSAARMAPAGEDFPGTDVVSVSHGEFGRISATGSMVLRLPEATLARLRTQGWIIWTPGTWRLAAPRNAEELDVIWQIFLIAYHQATSLAQRRSRREPGEVVSLPGHAALRPAESGVSI
jgi:hypothetical protein